ncbi:MAG: helix-turn-helix domain-containing protein, partial [Ferruginibacter sp.]
KLAYDYKQLKKMNLNTYIPTGILKAFIKCFLIIESEDELINKVLPGTSLTIAFRYKGKVNYVMDSSIRSLPVITVSGLRKSARLINYTENTGNLLVVFKEAGATAFFREPLHELFQESVSLENFVPRQRASMIEELLAGSTNNHQRIAMVEKFLLSKLYDARPDKLISTALEKIHSAIGNIKIKELAARLYISQDAFEKRFRKKVGASPKQFSSLVRMGSIIQQIPKNTRLLDMVFDGGYFDQAHFNKDFKVFTGQTPTEFFDSPSFW